MKDMANPKKLKLSRNVDKLKKSPTSAICLEAQRRRSAGEDIIDLSSEDLGFDTPRTISEAGIRAIQQSRPSNIPEAGLLELRVAIARQLSLLSGGRPVNADNIVISNGARQALFGACYTLFGSGAEVLVPAPAWATYPQVVHLARAKPIKVPGDIEWSLKVGVDQFERVATPDARGLILSSPVNPTGAVYTKAEIEAIVKWAVEKDLWIVSDELYRRIHFGSGPAPSILDLPDELLEKVVLIGGAGKTYSMTDWRIGYSLAPQTVSATIAALQTHMTGAASHPAQWAAAFAYSDERIEFGVQQMVEEIRHRRDLVVQHFRQKIPGVEFVEPLGAYYLFFRVDGFLNGQADCAAIFCERLLSEYGVALVPGRVFGDGRWVRLSYAGPEKDLNHGLTRISDLVSTLATRID